MWRLYSLTLCCLLIPIVAPAALVAHWDCNESDGRILHDSSGSYNGNLSDTASFVSGGISGNALHVSLEANGYVDMGDVLPMQNTSFTIVAWIKTTSGIIDDYSHIVAKHEAFTRNGYNLSQSRLGVGPRYNKAAFTSGDLPPAAIGTSRINDGKWHQLVGVYKVNGSKLIYVDGAPSEGTGPNQTIEPNRAGFMIGGVYINGKPTGRFTGLIDEVQVYDHPLTPKEIDSLYHRFRPVLPRKSQPYYDYFGCEHCNHGPMPW